jgi:hypothetical protein
VAHRALRDETAKTSHSTYRFNSPGAALLSAQFEVVGGWNGAMVKKFVSHHIRQCAVDTTWFLPVRESG